MHGFRACLPCIRELPPPPEPEQPAPPRGHLVFSEANGGCFELHWSADPVDGALACFLPREPVAEFKLSANGGRSELCRNVGGPNVKAFYNGWVSFVKMARKLEGSFTLLSNLPKQPVALYLAASGLAVTRLAEGGTVSFEGVRAVAVVGAKADGLSVSRMETQLFLSVGAKLGCSAAFVEAEAKQESPRLQAVTRPPTIEQAAQAAVAAGVSAIERAEQTLRV